MIWILFLIALVVYVVLSWTIVYHLQTYTINKKLARRAIILFVAITAALVIAQFVLFVFVEREAAQAITNVQEETFGSPF